MDFDETHILREISGEDAHEPEILLGDIDGLIDWAKEEEQSSWFGNTDSGYNHSFGASTEATESTALKRPKSPHSDVTVPVGVEQDLKKRKL